MGRLSCRAVSVNTSLLCYAAWQFIETAMPLADKNVNNRDAFLQAGKYLLVGVINTFVGLGVIYLSMYFLGLGLIHANVAGYSLGILVSFAVNKRRTFRNSNRVVSSFVHYIFVFGVAHLSNLSLA